MSKEALKLALEALEVIYDRAVFDYSLPADHFAAEGAQEAITAIEKALAQPEQEPVAYLDEGLGAFYFAKQYKKNVGFTPLYTTPPQRTWVGMTNEEKADLFEGTAPYYNELDYADAIEAKLKEKNT